MNDSTASVVDTSGAFVAFVKYTVSTSLVDRPGNTGSLSDATMSAAHNHSTNRQRH